MMTGQVGEKPDLSGIYRFLKRMEATGLVTSSWETGGQGHAKRLFKLTADGRACLARWTKTLEAYLEAIKALLKEAKTATARRPKRRKIAVK
jgi:DNA-binding PadR family transcriptional regulator